MRWCDGGTLRLTVAYLSPIYWVTSWFAQGVFADVGSMAVKTKFLPALYQAEVVLEINKSTDLSRLNHGSNFCELYTFRHSLVDIWPYYSFAFTMGHGHCSARWWPSRSRTPLKSAFWRPVPQCALLWNALLGVAKKVWHFSTNGKSVVLQWDSVDKLRGCNDRLDGCREVHELKDCGHLWT